MQFERWRVSARQFDPLSAAQIRHRLEAKTILRINDVSGLSGGTIEGRSLTDMKPTSPDYINVTGPHRPGSNLAREAHAKTP